MSEADSSTRSEAAQGANPQPTDNTVARQNVSNTPQANLNQQPASTNNQAQEQPQQNRLFSTLRRVLFNLLIGWMISRYFFSGRQSGVTNLSKDGTTVKSVASNNLFNSGFNLDLYVYITEDRHEPDFFKPNELKWVLKNIIYDDWTQGEDKNSIFSKEVEVELSPKVQRNGSLWIHSYFVKHNYIPYEATRSADNFSPIYTLHRKKQLNKYKKRRYRDTHNLLTGKTDKSPEEQEKIKNKIKEEVISHWHPNLTINMVYDHTAWTPNALPAPLNEYIDFEPNTGRYYPIVYLNDYWNLLRDYQPLNETVKKINLLLTYQPLSMMKWQLYAAQGMRNKWSSMLGAEQIESEDEQDYIKEALLETSPILLAMTIIFSVAHSICEFLAFKNDIQFWKDKKSLEGLSVRSVFFNLFQSVVVLLYVLDNDTNTLIKVSIGIGLLIELWKIPKVVSIKIDRNNKILGVLPRIVFEDKGSYVESSTKQYDMMAYKYLSWVIFPLFVGYAIYSLIYQEHKGWYSFLLNMIYGFLLVFGFIMMTPQLFINYKLKSVAHLPWRMLTYKFLNTFIDDVFAFVIKMPLMYRIGCFRDDIIFIIYLYQRFIYRVDPKRVNEYGVSASDLQDKDSTKALTGSAKTTNIKSTSEPGSSKQAPKIAGDKKND